MAGSPSFFACEYPVVPAPLIGRTILSPFNFLDTFVENWLTIDLWVYFWSLVLSHLFMPILMPVPDCLLLFFPHSLDYCNFVVGFEIRKCPPGLCFFFKIVLVIMDPLHFHMTGQDCTFLQRSLLVFFQFLEKILFPSNCFGKLVENLL